MNSDPLDGDPRSELDVHGYITTSAQELALIVDLLQAGRQEDALCHAISRKRRTLALMHTLELPILPEVDVNKTEDTARHETWEYKERPSR